MVKRDGRIGLHRFLKPPVSYDIFVCIPFLRLLVCSTIFYLELELENEMLSEIISGSGRHKI